MKIYSKQTVLEAALERIRYLFDEFSNVVVGFSGGKDSTVVFHLALQVAKEKNRLPLKVLWIDQEAEWQGTVDYCTKIMERKDVEPMWFQMPILMTNNASTKERFNYAWEEKSKDIWIHGKHNLSIKKNIYGKERFVELFEAIFNIEFKNKKACYISGVRTEESPSRYMGLTTWATYKHVTWGKVLNKKHGHYTFYPIYDWSYTDIWKYIHTNSIEYNNIYNEFYRYGAGIREMRISCLHHETALHHLTQIQKIEPQTWNKITERIGGANTIKILKNDALKVPDKLPYMFMDWKEYAEYLTINLVNEKEHQDKLLYFIKNDKGVKGTYAKCSEKLKIELYKAIIKVILANDWDYTKLTNWEDSPDISHIRKSTKDNIYSDRTKKSKYYVEN